MPIYVRNLYPGITEAELSQEFLILGNQVRSTNKDYNIISLTIRLAILRGRISDNGKKR